MAFYCQKKGAFWVRDEPSVGSARSRDEYMGFGQGEGLGSGQRARPWDGREEPEMG